MQVLEVLLERCLVKLRKKLRLGGDIEFADVVDELTFGHGYNTFQKATFSAEVGIRPPAKIGQSPVAA